MTRKGKIARLPQPIREQINRRLQNGEEGKQIAEWLNTLPEVDRLMAAEFDGQPINETNLSNWKLGGYRDWEAQQEALEAVRRFGADAAELGQAAGGQLADQLALCLTARIAVALRQPPSGEDDPAGQLQRLRRVVRGPGGVAQGRSQRAMAADRARKAGSGLGKNTATPPPTANGKSKLPRTPRRTPSPGKLGKNWKGTYTSYEPKNTARKKTLNFGHLTLHFDPGMSAANA